MQESFGEVLSAFPVLGAFDAAQLKTILESGTFSEESAGYVLQRENEKCVYVPLVLSGNLRIYKLSRTGRELTLFRTGPGEICIMSVACQLGSKDFPAAVEVERDVRMFLIPMAVYKALVEPNPGWKDYLIQSLYDRLSEALQVIEEVTFSRVDHRLADWLLEHCRGNPCSIYATHEQIAVELGSAREVVSRILGEFRDNGAVALSRGRIQVTDPAYLYELQSIPH